MLSQSLFLVVLHHHFSKLVILMFLVFASTFAYQTIHALEAAPETYYDILYEREAASKCYIDERDAYLQKLCPTSKSDGHLKSAMLRNGSTFPRISYLNRKAPPEHSLSQHANPKRLRTGTAEWYKRGAQRVLYAVPMRFY